MNHYDIPTYLRRKPKKCWYPSIELILLIASLIVLAASIITNWDAFPKAHAAERDYTGIIKEGVTYTPEQFCSHLSV